MVGSGLDETALRMAFRQPQQPSAAVTGRVIIFYSQKPAEDEDDAAQVKFPDTAALGSTEKLPRWRWWGCHSKAPSPRDNLANLANHMRQTM